MLSNKVVSREQWLAARKVHLAEEKAFTRMRDKLSAAPRELPRVRVDKDYTFAGPAGPETLSDLFGGKSQLIVQHFMFHPDWNAGCKSCSFWADGYDGSVAHLAARDTSLVTVSRAPYAKLEAFRQRMGWTFKWVSSAGSDFNRDFDVLFTPEELKSGADYNYTRQKFGVEDAPGIGVFVKDDAGAVFHTYSCYSRGLDMMNAAYHYLDLTPKGRDEDALPFSMSWLRLHDEYGR
jgi:predicted dithiol-disulfide oxidoreductase (DUF899 family)